MSNPTNFSCPSDIPGPVLTDFRPSKSLYVNVHNNNDFRLYMQRNARFIRNNNLQNFVRSMNCSCEQRSPGSTVIPFNSSMLDVFEKKKLSV